MICEISTDNLVDERQIGWIAYREGSAILRVKVVRARSNRLFLAHPTAYRKGTTVRVVEYSDPLSWNQFSKYLLERFREVVGDEHYFNFRKNEGKKS